MERASSWIDFLVLAGDQDLKKMVDVVSRVAARFTGLQDADRAELNSVLRQHVFTLLHEDSYPDDPRAWEGWVRTVALRRAWRWLASQRQAPTTPNEEWTIDTLIDHELSSWGAPEVSEVYVQMLENLQYLEQSLPQLGPQQERQGKKILKDIREGEFGASRVSSHEVLTPAERRARDRVIERMIDLLEERARDDEEQ